MNRKSILILFSCLHIFTISACPQKTGVKKVKSNQTRIPDTRPSTKLKDTVLKANYEKLSVPVTVKYADTLRAQLLVLPGWNFPDTQWCEKTSLCDSAKKRGFTLIFVEMQRSVYLRSYYKETRQDYRRYPTRVWLIDSVIMPLFKKSILDSTKPTFVMGLSTGGRGAAILALDYPTLFKGAASLSGDFDPELQKNDLLMVYSLGPYHQFATRWKGDNNITRRAKEFTVPLYIGHGLSDKVSPPAQSIKFAETLKRVSPSLPIKTNFPQGMEHNYIYWGSEVSNVLNFFLRFVKS